MDGSVLCYGVIWVLFGIFSPSISVFPIVKTTSLYRITLKYRLTLLVWQIIGENLMLALWLNFIFSEKVALQA